MISSCIRVSNQRDGLWGCGEFMIPLPQVVAIRAKRYQVKHKNPNQADYKGLLAPLLLPH